MKRLFILFASLSLTGCASVSEVTQGVVGPKPTPSPSVSPDSVSTNYCWNLVQESPEFGIYWPDGCNTPETSQDAVCAQVIIELTEKEIEGYRTWQAAGEPIIPGCL